MATTDATVSTKLTNILNITKFPFIAQALFLAESPRAQRIDNMSFPDLG